MPSDSAKSGYMTVKDASRRWAIDERSLRRLLADGRLEGAVKVGRHWAIPSTARRPRTTSQPGIQPLAIAEQLPCLLALFALDGTLVYLNRAWKDTFRIRRPSRLIGKLNALHDRQLDEMGIRAAMLPSFTGATNRFDNVRVPFAEIVARFGSGEPEPLTAYMDVVCYPMYGGRNRQTHVAVLYIPKKAYPLTGIVSACCQFLDAHPAEKMTMKRLAHEFDYSEDYLTRTFKSAMGKTPLQYHRERRIDAVKALLNNPAISIADAFAEIGFEYSGESAALFAKITGMKPGEYRRRRML